MRKSKEENNIVCLNFKSEFTGSSFIDDTFNKKGNIDRNAYFPKMWGEKEFLLLICSSYSMNDFT